MVRFKRLSLMISNKLYLVLALLTLLGASGCSSEKDVPATHFVMGKVMCAGGQPNAVKVSLENVEDPSLKYVAVTDVSGCFSFDEVLEGSYKMDAEKKGLILKWYKDGALLNGIDPIIRIDGSKDLTLFMMGESYNYGFALEITDVNGKPIKDGFKIPKGASTIAFVLKNPTSQNQAWMIRNLCFVSDDIGATIEFVFNSFSKTSGNLKPGESILVAGGINENIFTVYERSPRYSHLYFTIYDNYGSKDLSLDLDF